MIKPGDIVRALLPGVSETKNRPAVVISTEAYHQCRPDVLFRLVTRQVEKADTAFDCVIFDWEDAGLQLPSAMRSFLFTKPRSQISKIGTLSDADWREVQARLRLALEI